MKEYIEREAVLRIIDKYGCGNGSVLGYHSGAVDCAGSEIARIPAADVVEVVRCKDCKYCIPAIADDAEYELCIVDNDVFPVSVQKQHFCGRGKRKEG